MAVLLAKLRATRRYDHDVQDLGLALEVSKLLQLAALVWILVGRLELLSMMRMLGFPLNVQNDLKLLRHLMHLFIFKS